jgi:pimeloyl-ACP methyl ester carboxylesterase
MKTMSEATTHTLEVPGAVLTYDIRESKASAEPALMLIGSPMGASGFVTLASHFPDRTIVTYDPRGAERSVWTDEAMKPSPDIHADDLHRIVTVLGKGPVDLFASSGGAINALQLVSGHPETIRLLIAHEPPAAQVLPDREAALAAVRSVRDAYERSGFGAGMARFIQLTSIEGPIPADVADQPDPDPSMFGMPADDDGTRNDVLLGQNLISTTHWQPDFDALRAASTRIILAAGEESAGQMANRAAHVIAGHLGTDAVVFPSHHGGFVGGESGWGGKPEEFAVKLREVLDSMGHNARP